MRAYYSGKEWGWCPVCGSPPPVIRVYWVGDVRASDFGERVHECDDCAAAWLHKDELMPCGAAGEG